MKTFLKNKAFLATIGCLLFILLGVITAQQGFDRVSIFFYITAFIVGGYRQAKNGIETLIVEHELDVDILMVVAAIGSGIIGYWNDGAILIFIFSLSGALEELTEEKTNRDIEKIIQLRPEKAVKLENNKEIIIDADQLIIEDRILVRPGEKIPADGKVVKGFSSVNQAMITGESIPADIDVSDDVFAGTMNLTGALEVVVTKPSDETMLSQIIQLVQNAQSEMPPNQLFVEKFERIYAKIVIIFALIVLLAPPIFLQWTWDESIYRAMVFLVVASPCALVAAIMPTLLSAISNGARNGILYKGGVHVENAGNIKTVAFDKTGTLTAGKMRVTDLIPVNSFDSAELLRISASIESLSEHPIAKSIVNYSKNQSITLAEVENSQIESGNGVKGSINGVNYSLGKLKLIKKELITKEIKEKLENLEREGKTVIVCASEQQIIGLIALEDGIRKEAVEAIKKLKKQQIKVVMLTGDNQVTANAIGEKVGITEVYANLLPEDKVAIVKEIKKENGQVAMIGDGINDSPALVTADIGMAMGITGTDVALDTANIVLVSDDLSNIAKSLTIGRKANRIVKQNIAFALAVILILVVTNFAFGIQLPLGVLGHEGSTILVILNGLRMLR